MCIRDRFYGDKSGQGFYKKTKEKDANGRKVILALNLETLEYHPSKKPNLPSLAATKNIGSLKKRIQHFVTAEDKGAELVRKSLAGLFAYVSNRIPEISDNLYSIDDALKAGFAWDVGPFQYWDMVGIEEGIKLAEADGLEVADWVKDMVKDGHTSFLSLIHI